jgi:hypothetical protein
MHSVGTADDTDRQIGALASLLRLVFLDATRHVVEERHDEVSLARSDTLGDCVRWIDRDVAWLAVQCEVTAVLVRCDHPAESGRSSEMRPKGDTYGIDDDVDVNP